jgi:2-polyprenyl-3-methyl-5-hydroxy-6-metoxy-1,4-benzoquinol methylase
LARNGFDVFGFDFSENAVKVCREWAGEENLRARFETAPITSDPFPNQRFDAAVAAMIFENVAREEMDQATSLLRTKLNSSAVVFSLLNPFVTEAEREKILKESNNPTKGITSITYSDEEIRKAFTGFEILAFKKYPLQGLEFRGIALRKI